MGPIDYRPLFQELDMAESEARHVLAAAEGSWQRLVDIRRTLAVLAIPRELAVFAVGSLGRFESSAASDLDFAVVYAAATLDVHAADAARHELAGQLRARGHEVLDKTFRAPVELGALLGDIGGEGDTNLHLTYRALLLTEGAWLANAAAAEQVTDAIFAAYAQGAISRGRYLSSLQNDLHRYYRTICVDYRFKVESAGKRWAIRYFKLRHARKLWHLANLALFCQAARLPDDERDLHLATELPRPPLLRISTSLRALGALPLCADLLRAYDAFLAALAEPELRRGLDRIDYAARLEDPLFQRLSASADRFDLAAQAIVQHLWVRCNEHLVRYGLL
ncbi:MAG: hypothetical protein H0T76_19655 [Nannocystis sp.]|nr:DUF294 nucleotidyltransferase-like domain-containing protein [Nannocystis sp.]MBA3548708.1 hypothetical protein [Nannocystis sp.]